MAYEQILVRITGKDRIGLTAAFTGILAKYDAQILDIGQADIHSTLSLGLLIRMDEEHSGQVMKELLFKATELGVQIGFEPVPDDEYEEWAGRQGRTRYILTVIGRSLSAAQIEAAARIVADQGLDIDSIKRLTGRLSIAHPERNTRACIEFSLRGNPKDKQAMQKDLMRLSTEMGMDFSLQRDDMFRRMRRLICFDMDSTLIQTECIDELAERNGVGAEVRAITESAMRGEIDFKESFTRRVALLKGLDVSVMQEIAENLPITEGADRLMSVLKTYGYKIAILSGGFTFFGEYLRQRFGVDYVYANELEIGEDGKLTGRYLGEIVDGRRKADLLKLIAQTERVNLAQTIAVGDGANDLPMLGEAGLGIAFHAKPRVVRRASASPSTRNRAWSPTPGSPSTPSAWTASCTSWASRTATWASKGRCRNPMRPKLLSVFLFLLAAPLLRAQQTHVDEVSIDTRATFHQQTTDGVYDSHFQGDYLNLHIKGQLTDGLTFRVRQRLNKKIDEKNPFNATDFLWLKWQATPKWSGFQQPAVPVLRLRGDGHLHAGARAGHLGRVLSLPHLSGHAGRVFLQPVLERAHRQGLEDHLELQLRGGRAAPEDELVRAGQQVPAGGPRRGRGPDRPRRLRPAPVLLRLDGHLQGHLDRREMEPVHEVRL